VTGYRWLALGEDALPDGEHWLSPAEAEVLARLRYTKRRTEYLLRRLVTKHAVASVTGRSTEDLAGIEVRNAPSGAPFVCVDGHRVELGVSISDRAGWAVCVTCPTESPAVGCDLELVEPRTPGFVADFLTPAEQQWVASRPDPDAAANLIWSAKESALKVLQTGLRRDTRSVEVTVDEPRDDGWGSERARGRRAGVSGLVATRRPIPADDGSRRDAPAASPARRPRRPRRRTTAAFLAGPPATPLTSPVRRRRRCRAAPPRRR